MASEMSTHEALHMTYFFAHSIDRELCEHPAIQDNPEWLAKAEKICDDLNDLYQAIGAVHLDPETYKRNPINPNSGV